MPVLMPGMANCAYLLRYAVFLSHVRGAFASVCQTVRFATLKLLLSPSHLPLCVSCLVLPGAWTPQNCPNVLILRFLTMSMSAFSDSVPRRASLSETLPSV